ncbi:unnamed protein product [Nyctereutes procyonoides]|uniref:(raccoon dog) hypothetical protein n=1 Tax=Nyctereutes procyonoides TaxID=34880 RepID=A0A811YB00_NYCPR|nr:unnamed protein product [Nyctereutes procyonoides]
MSREHHQPTEPLHPRCSAHCDRAARAAAAAQPPPGTHSLARRPGRRRTEGREGGGGERRREREERGERREGLALTAEGRGGRGGEPCAKGSVGEANPQNKVISVQASALEALFPPRPGSGSRQGRSRRPGGGAAEAEGERPRWYSLVPPNRWLRTRRRRRRLPVRGRVAFAKGSENKQLKMAAAAAASHAPKRKRPRRSAAAQRAGRHHPRRPGGGTGWTPKVVRGCQVKHRGSKGGGRGCEGALGRGGWAGKLLRGSSRYKGGL